MITKKLQRSEDMFIQFTDDELTELGWSKGDKFSITTRDDGSVELKKYAPLELELDNFTREDLETLIKVSCEKDISVNEVIEEVLSKALLEDEVVNTNSVKKPHSSRCCCGKFKKTAEPYCIDCSCNYF